jgi:hypothetical protein
MECKHCAGCVVWQVLQKHAFGLEVLIATRETEQRCKRVASCEECDNEDGQYRLADPELWIFCVETWQYEVAARALACIPLKRHETHCDNSPSQYRPRCRQRYKPPVPRRALSPFLPRLVDVLVALAVGAH